jgi:hypothetical protein
MPDGVRELRPPRRLKMRDQVELTAVVGAVTRSAQWDDAQCMAASAE